MGFESLWQRIWRELDGFFADAMAKSGKPTVKYRVESRYSPCRNGIFPAFEHTTMVRAAAHEICARLDESS
jgi:hypothetical protein